MTGRPTPRRCAHWLTMRQREQALPVHADPRLGGGGRSSSVAALLEAHDPANPTGLAKSARGLDVTVVDRRHRLEDAFLKLNPDFGVLPEHDGPGQRALAWRREQAMTLGLRVLVELRNENTGAPAARQQVIARRAVDARERGVPALERRLSWDRVEGVER